MKTWTDCSRAFKVTVAIVGLLGVASGLFAGGLSATVWAADTRYEKKVDHDAEMIEIASAFADALNAKEKKDLKRMIRRLEYRLEKGTITDEERWTLKGLKDELSDLK